jgi:integrase/recombinase XerC
MSTKTRFRYSLNKNKYLLAPEKERLLEILKRFRPQDPRNCLLIELALRTGARASELLAIRKQDLNAYDRSILIRGIKGSNDRELPVSDDLFKNLEDWLAMRPKSQENRDEVFGISYDRLLQIWHHYRPVKKNFHSLRHTFAIDLYQKTKDIRLVQFALGHRNIANTMIYAEYAYSQSELRRWLVDSLPT